MPYMIVQAILRRFAATALLALIVQMCGSIVAAHADSCDDLARQLAGHITDLKVGATRGGVIYLQHPAVKTAWLGCVGQNVSNEVSAASPTKKPSREFLDFVASAAALVFTIPKGDTLSGAQRCVGRIGILRGYNIATRYRKLDIRCARTKDATQVTISRDKNL
jgi:hypothetical protein